MLAQAKCARDRLVILFGVQMGLRRVEMWRMQVADINFSERIVGLRGKNHRGEISRVAPITDEAWEALHVYLTESPADSGPLVRNVYGGRLSVASLSKLVSEAMTRAGVKEGQWDGKSLHGLRHTCIQHLVDAGHDIRDVQALAGHKSVQVTEIYLRRQPTVDKLHRLAAGRHYMPTAATPPVADTISSVIPAELLRDIPAAIAATTKLLERVDRWADQWGGVFEDYHACIRAHRLDDEDAEALDEASGFADLFRLAYRAQETLSDPACTIGPPTAA